MSPTKTPGSATYRFNRYVRGVGRFVNSSGARTLTEFRYRDGILTKLIRLGALDTLRLFKSRTLSMNELITADREGRLERVGEQLRLGRPLAEAVKAWLPESAKATQSRRRYASSWAHFWRVVLKATSLRDTAKVGDLARIDYHHLRRAWGAGPADWNRARAMLSAFLSRFLGAKQHPFRYEVLARFPHDTEPLGRVPELEAADFWKIVGKAPEYAQPAYVAMAVLGVGPGEYARLRKTHLRKRQGFVIVPGTKTRERAAEVAVDARLWPWIERAVPPVLGYKWLRIWWRRACKAAELEGVWMYDLRHLSGQLAADLGATDRDIMIHLRHANAGMTHRYTKRRVARAVAGKIGDALAG